MKTKSLSPSELASALGKLAAKCPKNYTAAERWRRSKRMKALNKSRRNKTV